jgi:hypothetical protein
VVHAVACKLSPKKQGMTSSADRGPNNRGEHPLEEGLQMTARDIQAFLGHPRGINIHNIATREVKSGINRQFIPWAILTI